jgi:hypothetical protein
MTGAFGEEKYASPPPIRPPERHGFKRVVTRKEWYGTHSHSERSPWANDGDTAPVHVSIHVL